MCLSRACSPDLSGSSATGPDYGGMLRCSRHPRARAAQPPTAADAGLGGTYFFLDSEGRQVAIIKPVDEEPLAPNNPKVPPAAGAMPSPKPKPFARVPANAGH